MVVYPRQISTTRGDGPSDDIGLTRILRDFTSYVQGLEPSDLTPADHASLRALLDDLKALRDMA